MRTRRGATKRVALAGLAALVGGLLPLAMSGPGATPAGAAGGPAVRMEVIASGLNNPRGLAFGPQDLLYVGEAGLGAGDASGVKAGIGPTSSVTVIARPGSSNPAQRRVLAGLPSGAMSEGKQLEAIGADGVSVTGHGTHASIYTIIGANSGPGLGQLVRGAPDGTFTSVADVGAADLLWTDQHKNLVPDQFPDANPYGVLVTGGHTYVVDAGANTLDEVRPDGTVQILAFFPNTRTSDATPTCVTQGPDGALYIGTLALSDFFTFGPGTATVYRVDPSTVNPNDLSSVLNAPTVWATGFSTITGCTFGPDGTFYAAEMFTGDAVRVPFAHPATGRTYIGVGQLHLPNGVAVGNDGAVYVSNNSDSIVAGSGEVVRFRVGGTTSG